MSRIRKFMGAVILFPAVLAFVMISGCSGSGGGKTDSDTAEMESPADARIFDMQSLLPGAEQAGGWKVSTEPRVFVADNLWEYINGGAEGYLVYNFQTVITADYESADGGQQTVVDIYRMADQLCGFGIYSAERNSFAPRVDIGSEGYLTENALHFWQGPYYVKVTAFESGQGEQLEILARAVGAGLDSPAGNPPQIAAFPQEGLQAGSERYMARDVLGHSELKNGFSADYELDGVEFKLFFILHDEIEQAANSFNVYKQFMEQYSKGVEEPDGMEYPLFTAQDSYYGKVVTIQSGRAVAVTLGLEDTEKVNSCLRQLIEKLSSQGMI
jgi:hypothetical protein